MGQGATSVTLAQLSHGNWTRLLEKVDAWRPYMYVINYVLNSLLLWFEVGSSVLCNILKNITGCSLKMHRTTTTQSHYLIMPGMQKVCGLPLIGRCQFGTANV